MFTMAGVHASVAATFIPDFDAATFDAGAAIDNPYFPLDPSYQTTVQASGIDEDGEAFFEESQLSFGGPGRVILGVQTTVQRDLAFEDGLLVEDTFDYYAQDTDGNVWYMGEDVINYIYDDDGNLIETNNSSAWIAGENGALPGWIMPAEIVVGFEYFQEVSPADAALDQAMIWATGLTVTSGGSVFEDVLAILETTSLDPEAREFKYYAPGVGLIRVEEGLDEAFGNPELIFERVDMSEVPIPASLPLLLGGLAGLAAVARARVRKNADAFSI
ncbi:MAG: VPLPA-CTERM sorting domain-containing protein [Silicimonas sp.]|nr:VPLPA-CTERM sorting domain-containing protein [Silicimonas sp.]